MSAHYHPTSLRDRIRASIDLCEEGKAHLARSIAAFGITPEKAVALRKIFFSTSNLAGSRVRLINVRFECKESAGGWESSAIVDLDEYDRLDDNHKLSELLVDEEGLEHCYLSEQDLYEDFNVDDLLDEDERYELYATPTLEFWPPAPDLVDVASYTIVEDIHPYVLEPAPSECVLPIYRRALSTSEWCLLCIEPNMEYWRRYSSEKIWGFVTAKFECIDVGKNYTPIENRLRELLDRNCISYTFQYPVKAGGRNYKLDFYIETNGKCLAVECDGAEFHKAAQAKVHDRERDIAVSKLGISTLRLPGALIINRPDYCLGRIKSRLGLR